ncbi:hypothetical protein [Tsuneonella mangrovi]|uniref:hypothetical protein n=1 Tax=Tsuneonella mangrovi TaxID=1982042 RepID=UPI000BA27004|nr:hypothetical protein [Tsuneonella mangrovi]
MSFDVLGIVLAIVAVLVLAAFVVRARLRRRVQAEPEEEAPSMTPERLKRLQDAGLKEIEPYVSIAEVELPGEAESPAAEAAVAEPVDYSGYSAEVEKWLESAFELLEQQTCTIDEFAGAVSEAKQQIEFDLDALRSAQETDSDALAEVEKAMKAVEFCENWIAENRAATVA